MSSNFDEKEKGKYGSTIEQLDQSWMFNGEDKEEGLTSWENVVTKCFMYYNQMRKDLT